jgi:hypothetical protein
LAPRGAKHGREQITGSCKILHHKFKADHNGRGLISVAKWDNPKISPKWGMRLSMEIARIAFITELLIY